MSMLLINAEVITIDSSGSVYKDCCIGISGSTIDYVGKLVPGLKDKYDRVMDLKGGTVMPGFVNAHNHGAMVLFRNYADDLKLMEWLFDKIFPLEDKLDGDIVYWGTCLAILEMIKSGTTTYNDMYFFMEDAARAAGESGIRAVLSRGLQGDIVDGTDRRMKEALELHAKYNNSFDGRLKVALSAHSIYTCSRPYLGMAAEKSAETGIPLQIHLSETVDEVKGAVEKYGMSPVRLLDSIGFLNSNTLAAHCVVVDDGDIQILRDRGVSVVHNPGSNMKLASGIAPVERMLKEGINVCLGTDGASSNNNLDMLEEARMASYLQKVSTLDPTALPADTALEMATLKGAKALGLHNAGSIETGMAADLIVLNTNKPAYYPRYNIKSALVYSGNSADVETVIIDGRVVMEKGRMLTMDEERIYREAERCREKLTS